MSPSTPPPSIVEVLATVSAILVRRGARGLVGGLRRVALDGPRAVLASLVRTFERAGPVAGRLGRSLAARRHILAGLLRRSLLLGSMGVLAVAGGSLVAAHQGAWIPSSPEVFFAAFAVCGGLCIAAPERRLRLGGLAVGSLNGAFAALTWFGTH